MQSSLESIKIGRICLAAHVKRMTFRVSTEWGAEEGGGANWARGTRKGHDDDCSEFTVG